MNSNPQSPSANHDEKSVSTSTPPGFNYCNWIEIAKQQLKEREVGLMTVRIIEIESTVNKNLSSLHQPLNHPTKFIVSQQLIAQSFLRLCNKIDNWNGVRTFRTKSSLNQYKDYFKVSKNWWDQTKNKLIGAEFWIHVFHYIQKFVRPFGMLPIIQSLFEANVKYHNTRPQPLINGGAVLYSDQIRHYLCGLHPVLRPINKFNSANTSGSKDTMKSVKHLLRTAVDLSLRQLHPQSGYNANQNPHRNQNQQQILAPVANQNSLTDVLVPVSNENHLNVNLFVPLNVNAAPVNNLVFMDNQFNSEPVLLLFPQPINHMQL
eukprot:208416_1